MPSPLATIAVSSIGEMGTGVAKLLISQGYRVVTNLEGRSKHTAARIAKTTIEVLETDASLVKESDYVLSIVPPRDAFATAQRITTALKSTSASSGPTTSERKHPLYYLDLNAISPKSSREIATLFENETPSLVRFIDGGIIGSAPHLKPSTAESITINDSVFEAWKRPSVPLSGPHTLSSAPVSGPHLSSVLNTRHLTPTIGSASGLKMTFAATTKGFAALCIQAFTTAQNLGVLEELRGEMEGFNPGTFALAEKLVTAVPPKAYRWVGEMKEISATLDVDGGFEGEGDMFRGAAEVYRIVADETVLGEERTESRKRGRTTEDVATAINEGLKEKRKKRE